MKTFPIFLKMTGRRVVIVGGGEQAAQKTRLLARTEALLVLIWPELDGELAALVEGRRAEHVPGPVTTGCFRNAALVVIATGCPALDASLHALAAESGTPINVVDRPDLCDVFTPSIVDRDPVVVAIGTEGTAPVLARQIRAMVETMLDPRLGGLAALAGRMRPLVARHLPRDRHRAFWRWVFEDAPRRLHESGAEAEAAQCLEAAIARGSAPDAESRGLIVFVDARAGAADLLTLRALRHLQEADLIVCDPLVAPGILELARRDAERAFVGSKSDPAPSTPAAVSELLVTAALRGRRVVRLMSRSPRAHAHRDEALAAARAAGVPVEIVPGVMAAGNDTDPPSGP